MNVPESKRWLVYMDDEELNVWAETLEILNDVEAMQAIHRANEELAKGKMYSFEQVFRHEQPDHP